MTAAEIRHRDIALPHGITLACREAVAGAVNGAVNGAVIGPATGAAGPRVLLLHGFPEAAFVWDEVMALLASGPLRARCTAPNLRGFPGSSAPAGVAAYRARHLAQDVVALIEALEADGGPDAAIDALVAHDWGGAVAWAVAALHPQRVRRLVIVNSPHPATFLRELRYNPAQQAASAYMNYLCRPDAAARLAERDFARLWPFFGQAAWLTPAPRDRYRAAWGAAGAGLEAPLNYYRASPLRPPTGPDDALHTLQLPDALVRVSVPTRVLWGEGDVALLPALLDGLSQWVPDLHLVRLPEATHWVIHEQPARVAAEIEAALAI